MRAMLPAVLATLLALLWLQACESPPDPELTAEARQAAAPPPPPPPLDRFSAQRAWSDLEALVAIGPRVSGTPGAARARDHIMAALFELGVEVHVIETPRQIEERAELTLQHVSALLPGASSRRIVLVAPYDSSRFPGFEYVGANDGASGAALLLELGRVLSQRSLPYTIQLLFIDGEGRFDGAAEGPAAERWHGSSALAEHMEAVGELDLIRLLVAFHQVCDADLRIARDLFSHRMHREEFFRAAQRVGRPGAFPTDEGFESLEASHRAFRERGVRGAVGLADTSYGGDEAPGALAESADDTLAHCSPESLEAVGLVTLEALDTIGRRLAKIDRFTRSPLAEVEPEAGSAATEDGVDPQETDDTAVAAEAAQDTPDTAELAEPPNDTADVSPPTTGVE